MSRLANISRLTLGTAQIGMSYGIVNRAGDIGTDGASALLDKAWALGITCLDTARAYGESEHRIGAWLRMRQYDPTIVSKVPALGVGDEAAAIEQNLSQTLMHLGRNRIDALLCHRADDLQRPAVRAKLESLVAEGRIERFGVSAYSPEHMRRAIAIETLGVIQVPVSLANSIFVTGGAIEDAAARGVLVFARSVYLQGLLLTPPERLPKSFDPLSAPIRALNALAREIRCDISSLALAAVNAVPGVHSIVVGAETAEQLEGTVKAFARTAPGSDAIAEAWSLFRNAPPELVDPNRWPAR